MEALTKKVVKPSRQREMAQRASSREGAALGWLAGNLASAQLAFGISQSCRSRMPKSATG